MTKPHAKPRGSASPRSYARAARAYRALALRYRAAGRLLPSRDTAALALLEARAGELERLAADYDDWVEVQRLQKMPRVYTKGEHSHG